MGRLGNFETTVHPPAINQGATIIKNAYALSRNFHGRRVGRVQVIHCRKGDSRYCETCLFGSSNPQKKTLSGAGASSGGLGGECFVCNNDILIKCFSFAQTCFFCVACDASQCFLLKIG